VEEPSADVISGLKSKFPNRALQLVEAVDGDESYFFIMTGCNKDEYQKFNDDVMSAKDSKDDKSKAAAFRSAVERTAIAMIKWPDRETVEALFKEKPAMSMNFAEELHKAAGSNVEVRSKKL